ncbi:DUF6065 family protein [Streptomyces sp. AC495_CC817]|uniref:DUF6065 family protein n=1 Tax=Streptomyces sp. AC495_CC817 TaxID=2823900 RepID=UPI001C272636|nr:DUF6065 family protein [Streptomyces sp. AC495_CC817]
MTTIEFYSLYDGAPMPRAASDDLSGSMPVRAAQLCTPLKEGSSNGFHLYPTVDFALRWDGHRTEVCWDDDPGAPPRWMPLDGGADVFLPGAEGVWHAASRAHGETEAAFGRRGVPFVNADPRGQHNVEITLGLIARTPPGYALQLRAPANLLGDPDVQIYEGIVESDWFRSYLPVILRLRTPSAVVRFRRSVPIAQVSLVAMADLHPAHTSVAGVAAWPEQIWREFVRSRAPREQHARRGSYASAARRAARNGRDPYTHDHGDHE